MKRLTRSELRLPLSAGAVAVVASLFFPMSTDERIWVAIARMVAAGRVLYVDVVDNKTPLVYFITWIIDITPGPFAWSRAVVVGALVAAITFSLNRLVPQSGSSKALAVGAGGLLSGVLSQFHLTAELPALALLLAIPLTRRPSRVVLAVVLAAAFDPRVLILIPAVLLWRRSRTLTRDHRAEWLTAAAVGLGVIVVFLVPKLRFGLVELNLASRPPDPDLGIRILVGLAAALPLAVLALVGFRWRRGWASSLWLAGALVIPSISLYPYDHYWMYLVGLIGVGMSAPRASPSPLAYVAITISLLALLATAWAQQLPSQLVAEHVAAAESIRTTAPGEDFLYFGVMPMLAEELPVEALLRAPTAHYLSWETSRREEFIDEFLGYLSTASVVALDNDIPLNHPGVDAMRIRLTCVKEFDSLTVYFEPEVCD